MCDHEKQRCVKEEKYDQAKGFKIRRDEMKLRRDRQIDENLYQYGFRLVDSNLSSFYCSF